MKTILFIAYILCTLNSSFAIEKDAPKTIRLHLATAVQSLSKNEDEKVDVPGQRTMFVSPTPIFIWKKFKSVERTTQKILLFDESKKQNVQRDLHYLRIVLEDDDAKLLSNFTMPKSFKFAFAANESKNYFLYLSMQSKITNGELFILIDYLTPESIRLFEELVRKVDAKSSSGN